MSKRAWLAPSGHRFRVGLLVVSLVAAQSGLSRAEAPADAAVARDAAPLDPRYQLLVDEGIREYRLHNFAEARSLLARAHELYPNARALRAIGMAEFELRHYRESAAALAASLASTERALDEQQRVETQQLLVRAENFLTHVSIQAEPWPTVVYVDGASTRLQPGSELVLEVGDHVLEFAAPGHLGERRQVRAVGGESLVMNLSLLPITVTPFALPQGPWKPEPREQVAAPAAAPVAPPIAPSRSRRTWLWSSAIVASAALAAGLGFGLSGRERDERAPVAAEPIAIRRGP
jgi:hypothetical protein